MASLNETVLNLDDSTLKTENRSLKKRLHQTQAELETEQDSVATLRRKLNNIEKDRLNAVSKSNEEVSHMDGEVTKLRAQIELGEAVRQNLEYELVKSRKDVLQEIRNATDREALMLEVNESMKQKVTEMTNQIEQLCEELDSAKTTNIEENNKLTTIIEEKVGHISKHQSEKDAFDIERERMQAAIQHKDKIMAETEDRLQLLEGDGRQQSDAIRRQVAELELTREKEERLRRDYELTLERIQSLEENIEAERAAHLETKFNSEIVQLRIRDLENAIELEKTSKSEALGNAEKLTKQIKELQKIYDSERKSSHDARNKLERTWQPVLRAEKEYSQLNKQMHHELEEKRCLIKDLSNQLQQHQQNFDELKAELNKAKKRQVYLEETYTGSMKELELLIDSFRMDSTTQDAPKKKTAANKKKDPRKTPSPAVLLESLRHMLVDYKRKVDAVSNDLTRVKAQNEHIVKETQTYKDLMWAKDKALETTHQGVTHTSKELRKAQEEVRKLEAVVKHLQEEVQTSRTALEHERSTTAQLGEQIVKVATKCKSDEEGSAEFIQRLYRQLQYAHIDSTDAPPISNWPEMSVAITSQVTALINNLEQAQAKVVHVESVIQTREQQISQMETAHEEQLVKIASLAESRGADWQQEKEHIEKHYSKLLAEIHSRQKQTQSVADQAWDKLQTTDSKQICLEEEVISLRKQAKKSGQQCSVLLATCALLCGAYYPLYTRAAALGTQCQLLMEQLNLFEAFRRQVQALLEALSMENMSRDNTSGQQGCSPIMRFRRAAVAVMAANRLRHLGTGPSCKLFAAQDLLPGIFRSLVCVGYVETPARPFLGLGSGITAQKPNTDMEPNVKSWLSSPDLMSTIEAAMGDLENLISNSNGKSDQHHLSNVARSCFQKLVCQLPAMFDGISSGNFSVTLRDKHSVIQNLGTGLHCLLDQQGGFTNSQTVIAALQQRVLEYTTRLHQVEVERRQLRQQMGTLRQEHNQWAEHSEEMELLRKDLSKLREQAQVSVSREQFESVCEELNCALQREQEAQPLLQEQSVQLKKLSQRLSTLASKGNEKERTLEHAAKGLSAAQVELKRQDQRIRQLNRQTSQGEADRTALQENILDAERAIRTASRDRETLLSYISAIQKRMESAKNKLALASGTSASAIVDLTSLLSPTIIAVPSNHTGSDLAACQSLVANFVDTQRQAHQKMAALQEDIQSHKQHIALLKQELSSALQREIQGEPE